MRTSIFAPIFSRISYSKMDQPVHMLVFPNYEAYARYMAHVALPSVPAPLVPPPPPLSAPPPPVAPLSASPPPRSPRSSSRMVNICPGIYKAGDNYYVRYSFHVAKGQRKWAQIGPSFSIQKAKANLARVEALRLTAKKYENIEELYKSTPQ